MSKEKIPLPIYVSGNTKERLRVIIRDDESVSFLIEQEGQRCEILLDKWEVGPLIDFLTNVLIATCAADRRQKEKRGGGGMKELWAIRSPEGDLYFDDEADDELSAWMCATARFAETKEQLEVQGYKIVRIRVEEVEE